MDVARWETALRDILSLQPSVIVPGHGNLPERELPTDVLEYFRTVRSLVATAGGTGGGLEERTAPVIPPGRTASSSRPPCSTSPGAHVMAWHASDRRRGRARVRFPLGGALLLALLSGVAPRRSPAAVRRRTRPRPGPAPLRRAHVTVPRTRKGPARIRDEPGWQNCGTDGTCETREATIRRWGGRGSLIPDLRWELKEVLVFGTGSSCGEKARARPRVRSSGSTTAGRFFRIMALDIHETRRGQGGPHLPCRGLGPGGPPAQGRPGLNARKRRRRRPASRINTVGAW